MVVAGRRRQHTKGDIPLGGGATVWCSLKLTLFVCTVGRKGLLLLPRWLTTSYRTGATTIYFGTLSIINRCVSHAMMPSPLVKRTPGSVAKDSLKGAHTMLKVRCTAHHMPSVTLKGLSVDVLSMYFGMTKFNPVESKGCRHYCISIQSNEYSFNVPLCVI